MSTENTALVQGANRAVEITPEQIKTLTQAGIIPADTPPSQVSIFAAMCETCGLNPYAKQVHLVGYKGRYTPIIGIDGRRLLASRNPGYGGCDDIIFNKRSDGGGLSLYDAKQKKPYPETATATVYKIVGGVRVAFTHTASLGEFSTGRNKWETMPYQMLGKVAESFALRKAFPEAAGTFLDDAEIGAFEDAQPAKGPVKFEGAKRDSVLGEIAFCDDAATLKAVWDDYPIYHTNPEFIAAVKARKGELKEAAELDQTTEHED